LFLTIGPRFDETYLAADTTLCTLPELFGTLRVAQGRRHGLQILRFVLLLVNRGAIWQRLGEELVVDTNKLLKFGRRPVVDKHDDLVAMLPSAAKKSHVAIKHAAVYIRPHITGGRR
jgi:hypothetical protein